MIRVLLRCGAESCERGGGFDHAALAWHQSALAAVDPLVSFRGSFYFQVDASILVYKSFLYDPKLVSPEISTCRL